MVVSRTTLVAIAAQIPRRLECFPRSSTDLRRKIVWYTSRCYFADCFSPSVSARLYLPCQGLLVRVLNLLRHLFDTTEMAEWPAEYQRNALLSPSRRIKHGQYCVANEEDALSPRFSRREQCHGSVHWQKVRYLVKALSRNEH